MRLRALKKLIVCIDRDDENAKVWVQLGNSVKPNGNVEIIYMSVSDELELADDVGDLALRMMDTFPEWFAII